MFLPRSDTRRQSLDLKMSSYSASDEHVALMVTMLLSGHWWYVFVGVLCGVGWPIRAGLHRIKSHACDGGDHECSDCGGTATRVDGMRQCDSAGSLGDIENATSIGTDSTTRMNMPSCGTAADNPEAAGVWFKSLRGGTEWQTTIFCASHLTQIRRSVVNEYRPR